MFIVDTHCDTLYMRSLEPQKTPCVTLEHLHAGGITVQTCTLFSGPVLDGGAYERALAQLRTLDTLKAQGWKVVDSPFDASEGENTILISMEGGEILEDNLQNVAFFRKKGVRLIALTWNHENLIASPAKGGSQEGIKPFGWSVLKEMARLHIAADTSHLNEAGFWDLIEHHAHPPMASHSCCAALRPHFRNLTDAQIKALIARGGWIGINFYPAFLVEDGKNATVQDILAHIDHIVQLGGAKHVGFGSDFDGIECTPVDCAHPGHVPRLIEGMRKLGYGEETIAGIAGKNFLNYFKQIEA